MNKIRAIQELNKREIENGITPEGSWHVDYRDTAFIYFGGLPYELTEGDVITIFSQFGEPVFLKLARDKETGKSKGFGWLKYEDQRSTDLAVDNLGGADIAGRIISVDHARYKPRDDEDPEEFDVSWQAMMRKEGKLEEVEESEEEARPMLQEERELAILMRDHDDDDPMKGFLVDEKRKEVEEARRRADQKSRHDKHRHRPREGGEDERRDRRHRDRDRDRDRDRESRRHRDGSGDRERRRHRDRDDEDRDRRRERRGDDDHKESRKDGDYDRKRRHRDRSQESRHKSRRDDDRRRRRSRSRSPRHDEN